jgi:hypothetical protein
MNQNSNLDNLLQQGHLLLERGQYESGLATFQEADNLFPNCLCLIKLLTTAKE